MSVIVDIPLVDSFSKDIVLEGYLTIPNDMHTNSIVIFVHGSGSSKDSVRNQYLAKELNKNSITTFLFNLLTKEEQESDKKVEQILKQVPGLTLNKFNISLLTNRLIKATEYLLETWP
jgi:putative phosphoribosyl transferase